MDIFLTWNFLSLLIGGYSVTHFCKITILLVTQMSVCKLPSFVKTVKILQVYTFTLLKWTIRCFTQEASSYAICSYSLRKHAYSNILNILPTPPPPPPPTHTHTPHPTTKKKWKFSDKKKSDIFHISAQNINCGYSSEPPRGGGSNEYPQSMF